MHQYMILSSIWIWITFHSHNLALHDSCSLLHFMRWWCNSFCVWRTIKYAKSALNSQQTLFFFSLKKQEALFAKSLMSIVVVEESFRSDNYLAMYRSIGHYFYCFFFHFCFIKAYLYFSICLAFIRWNFASVKKILLSEKKTLRISVECTHKNCRTTVQH